MMNLEVFKNCIDKEITIELSSLTFRTGRITEFDDFGIYFVPSDNTSDMIIAWHNINKLIMEADKLVVIEPFDET
ncbi:MAG: hypothetical protein K0A90_06050 [Methanosarcinaceae archaeon]|nr:hypothetical protein [Methanosarcinaceae archaeon]